MGGQRGPRPLLAVALVGMTLVACSGSRGHAVVSGHFLRYGGQYPGGPVSLAGTTTATSADGSTTSTAVHDDGFFRLSLRPGEYSLVGQSHGLGTCSSIYDGIAKTLTEKMTVTNQDRTVDVWCVID